MRLEVSREIAAPSAVVWDVLADVESWPAWTPTMRSVQLLDGAPFGEGARVRIRQPRLPTVVWTVDDLRPGHGFTWTAGPGSARTRASHEISDLGDGRTRVVLSFEQSGLAAVFGALTASMTRRYVETEAESLQRRCETGA